MSVSGGSTDLLSISVILYKKTPFIWANSAAIKIPRSVYLRYELTSIWKFRLEFGLFGAAFRHQAIKQICVAVIAAELRRKVTKMFQR